MGKFQKIQLIEPSLDDNQEVFRQELEEALGGWNCGSYYDRTCEVYDDKGCSNVGHSGNYCTKYLMGS